MRSVRLLVRLPDNQMLEHMVSIASDAVVTDVMVLLFRVQRRVIELLCF